MSMEITNNYATYNVFDSTKRTDTEKKPTNVSDYYDYLRDKYSCLSAKDYKVTLTKDCLERCIKDPKFAEEIERNLAAMPSCHQSMTASWAALGGRLVNEEWIFRGDGTCGSTSNMYVTSSPKRLENTIHNDRSDDKKIKKKSISQESIEKKKKLMEQLQAKRLEKKRLLEKLEEKAEKERDEKSRTEEKLAEAERNSTDVYIARNGVDSLFQSATFAGINETFDIKA